jgi:P-type Cu2+ transporter
MGALTTFQASPADLSRYVRHDETGASTFSISVKGARCAACIGKIETGVKAIPGIADARLNLSTGKLLASWRGKAISPDLVLQRVRDLGYEAQPFDAPVARSETEREGSLLLRCLAVAAFATIFVVGLTDSIWWGGADMSSGLRQTFFWLAATVAVPATLYSGQPFFRSAWNAMRARTTNMDVPISAALLLSLGLSLYQTFARQLHTYFDAAAMLAFLLLIGRYLEFHLRDKAQGAARHLLALQTQLAQRFAPDGKLETIASRDIAPGDRLLISTGERVPVDAELESALADLDVSLVTGESRPQVTLAGTRIYAGSVNVGQAAVARATARVENSLVADLARLLDIGRQRRNVYVRLADRAARIFVPSVLGLAAAVFLMWLACGASLAVAATNAIAVLIITCPCALGLAVPAVQVAATSRLFARGVLVKTPDALERLAEIDTVVFDKTGTLTEGKLRLANAHEIAPGDLQSAARLARASQHPMARALAAAAGPGPVAMDVRETAGAGLESRENGVPIRLGSAAWCGARAQADSSSQLWFCRDGKPPVRFVLQDNLRPDVHELVATLGARGLAVEMLTGDNATIARQIALEVGISIWHAEVKPAGKAARLEQLRSHGRRVLMVGDGLNDAAALALAHVSIAPGSAADVSQLAADMVLRSETLLPILEAIGVARKARVLILENFGLAALYNLLAIPLAALGFVTPLLAAATMSSSSLLVSLNALRLTRGEFV